MNRTQYTVYESFYKSIARMRKKSDQADTFIAMSRLALYGEMPDLDELPDNVAAVLESIIPNILSSIRKAEAGKRGGESKGEAREKDKQTPSKPEANAKQEKTGSEIESEIEVENECYKKVKKEKHRYGSYKNVLLTDAELETLKTEFSDWEARIERLSEYIASKGDKYKSHLATIRSWARKDGVTAPAEARPAPTVTDTATIKRLLETM